jgi:hypothetical protein
MLRRAVACLNGGRLSCRPHWEGRAPTIVTRWATDDAKERANLIPVPLSHCDDPYPVSVGCVQRLSNVTERCETWSWE